MIVVDTNIIAYLLIDGPHTSVVELFRGRDEQWVAPVLWKSELRNVLSRYMRHRNMARSQAEELMREAEQLMRHAELQPSSEMVFRLVDESNCSAYDCEFVALALTLGVRLVTTDKEILATFPDIALSLSQATRSL